MTVHERGLSSRKILYSDGCMTGVWDGADAVHAAMHEQEKFAAFNTDLQTAEQKCVPANQSSLQCLWPALGVSGKLLMHAR